MSANPLKIPRFDTREYDVARALADLRERLSPRSDVVSEAGRRRTIEVFGEPLSPAQVVERICNDVRDKGSRPCSTTRPRIDKRPAHGRRRFACRPPSWRRRMRRPIRSFWPPCGGFATISSSFKRRFCRTTCTVDGPRRQPVLAAAVSAAASGSASACRAGRRPIRRPC